MSLREVHQQSQAVCQSVQNLVLVEKDRLRQADTIEVWTGPERDDRTSELDTG